MNIFARSMSVSIILGLAGLVVTADALADRMTRFERENPAGGTTAGINRHISGENGGLTQRRVIRSDGEGNGRVSSGGTFHGPNGAVGGRAGTTTFSSDGSAQHQSGMAVSGSQGSVKSTGSATVDANGNVTQSRDTSVTNATTGNSYQGSTSYNSSTGVTHSATCYDGSGNVIACPSR